MAMFSKLELLPILLLILLLSMCVDGYFLIRFVLQVPDKPNLEGVTNNFLNRSPHTQVGPADQRV